MLMLVIISKIIDNVIMVMVITVIIHTVVEHDNGRVHVECMGATVAHSYCAGLLITRWSCRSYARIVINKKIHLIISRCCARPSIALQVQNCSLQHHSCDNGRGCDNCHAYGESDGNVNSSVTLISTQNTPNHIFVFQLQGQ